MPNLSSEPVAGYVADPHTIKAIEKRLLPFLFVLYVISYLDRANVAFAKQSMSAALGFSEAAFGLGAGLFFLGYFLFEIPGALLVERWSARRWFARILITWGLCTVVIGFVKSDTQFYWMRFLLGCAEAGFFPGVIVYLSHWFPMRYRSKAVSRFALAIPFSLIVGGPFSGWLLKQSWMNIEGWRWVFIAEGIPAVLAGVLVWRFLPDRPSQVTWLTPVQRNSLEKILQEERSRRGTNEDLRSLRIIFLSLPAWLLAFALFFCNVAMVGYMFWLPSNLQKAGGLSTSVAAVVTAIPFVAGMGALWIAGSLNQPAVRRFRYTWIPMAVAVVFFIPTVSLAGSLTLLLVFYSLTAMSLYAWVPSFWALPHLFWSGSLAAAAIGLINSVGNLGGFAGPTIVGLLLTRYNTYSVAVFFLSISLLLGAASVYFAGKMWRDLPE